MTKQLRLLAGSMGVLLISPLLLSAATPLPRDPNNIYGQFDNGLKYIIRAHDNPPDRIEINLHVMTGALNENANQNGLAHFLEHMGFNGTTHFKPGELIPHLSTMGMTFGAHSNAHTNYHETVYKLSMPNTEDKTIETALTVFEDFANGMLLLAEEVDNERGIILEEARSRKSAQERIQKQFMKNVFEGTRLAEHDIIGKEEQIEKFPKAEFDDYWNTWYRPENMVLVVVGDIDPQEIIAKAKPHFGEFKARAAARPPKNGGVRTINKPRAFVFTDPELPSGRVQLLAVNPGRPPIKTFEQYRFDQIENIGPAIVNRRLSEKVQKGEAAFFGAFCFVQGLFNEAILPGISARGLPENWNKMLEQMVVEVSRAVEHGFTEREFELVKESMIARAERAVETEPTRDARRLVSGISRAIGTKSPILSAQQRLDLNKQVLANLSLTEVHQVFVDHFKTKNFTYVITLPEKDDLTVPSSEDVLAAAAEAWSRKTTPVDDVQKIETLLTALPTPGKIVKQTTDADLKITTATLSNGAIVHHRFMDYKKDNVSLTISFAGGAIEETAANRGVSQVAGLVNATSKYDSTQIRDFMTGKKIRVGGGLRFDTGSMNVSGSPEDLEIGLQLAYAYMTDGKIEQSAFDNWKDSTLQFLEQRKTSARGQLSMAMDRVFYAGDVRYADLTPEQLDKLSPAQGEKWFKRIVNTAAIEVSVVGDIKLERAMDLVTRYVGSLPVRSLGAAEALKPLRKLKRGPGPFVETVKFDSITPKAVVRAGYIGAEQSDLRDTRLLSLASRILSERMIKRIREEESIVYGIRCSHRPSVAIPQTGMISAGTTTDPKNAEKLANIIIEMLEDFAANGPTDEEVVVAKKQIANDLDKSMLEPRFWQGQLTDLHYRGRTLAELKELPEVYQTFSTQEIHQVTKKYMTKQRMVRFIALPNQEPVDTPVTDEAKVPVGS